jgi:hypothetical protein
MSMRVDKKNGAFYSCVYPDCDRKAFFGKCNKCARSVGR